jgi:hypothetical protein
MIIVALPGLGIVLIGRNVGKNRGVKNEHPEEILQLEATTSDVLKSSITLESRTSGTSGNIFPIKEVEKQFQIVNDKQGLFHASASVWICPLIAGDADEMTIRTSGLELTKDKKKELGVSTRARFGARYIESLSSEGLKVAQAAASLYMLAIRHSISSRQQIASFRKLGCRKVEIVASQDERTCKAAFVAAGRKIPIDEAQLPLPNCDAEYCRCVFTGDPDSMR